MLMIKICNSTLGTLCSHWKAGYGSAKRKYGVGGMDEVWNRKYERGPIRIASILSIYARMASKSARCTKEGSKWRPTSNFSAREQRFIEEWAIWLSKGAPKKTLCSLAWTAQSAPSSRINSP